MREILNKFAIWLYKKTNNKVKSSQSIFNGIKVIESKYIEKGTCIMGSGDIKDIKKSFINEELLTN